MIIDSHAHYCHKLYEGEFSYLAMQEGDFVLDRGDRRQLLAAMQEQGIVLCIEPGTSLEKTPDQLALASEFAPYFRLAAGVHPKQCAATPWEDREKLRAFVMENAVVAIGETGLDYSVAPEALDKPCQEKWFRYQIQLAHARQLPLILHIREANQDALEILRQHRAQLCGGVAHCFGGDYETAMAYVDLGFALGIGGRLLQDDPQAWALQDAVRRVPAEALLVETDAPYIRPDIRELPCSGKQRKRARNTSLILPAVLDQIAKLRGTSRTEIEEIIYQNTLRIFRLDKNTGDR